MLNPDLLKGIYAITPDLTDSMLLTDSVESVLSCGIKILQYRNKAIIHDSDEMLKQVESIQKICQKHNCLFIINDDPKIAKNTHAGGVHLGKDDFNLENSNLKKLREDFRLSDKIIGVSCYNNLNLAKKAILQNADYIAFGAVFSSQTKPNATSASLNLLIEARKLFKLPIVAIGGINLENANQIMQTGVNCMAMISALFEPFILKQDTKTLNLHLRKIKNLQEQLITREYEKRI